MIYPPPDFLKKTLAFFYKIINFAGRVRSEELRVRSECRDVSITP